MHSMVQEFLVNGKVDGMLLQFNFKNFKSFKAEAVLDLTAPKKDAASDRLFSLGDESILPVTAIYGANASGKSNLYQAFAFMTKYVIHSFSYGDEKNNYETFAPTPFIFDKESANGDSSFEVFFSMPKDESETIYNYGFCLNKTGVTEEWLNRKDKISEDFSLVFYRGGEQNELDLSGISKTSQQNIKVALEDQVLVVSLGAKLKIAECKVIRDWFISNKFTDFASTFTNIVMATRLPANFIESKEEQKKVADFLASFDGHIKDFKVEEIEKGNGDKAYKISTLHKINNTCEMAEIPLRDESAGTLKMFSLYPELKDVLEKGSVFFIDELNARLHPLLVRNILITFINPRINVNHAQLVFTAHDTWQLDNHILKKEEVWFVKKDKEGKSQLYSLADFSDINDFNQDDYLLGKYGAVPELSRMEFNK